LAITEAEKFWKANLPEALDSGRVRLIEQDMFTPQPDIYGKPDIFIVRQVLHNWSDAYATRVLEQLRMAAGPDTRLLIADHVLSNACSRPPNGGLIKGTDSLLPPAPLLANMGGAAVMPYVLDILMLVVQNGQQRTLSHFVNMLQATGWVLQEMKRTDPLGVWLPHLIAVPR